MRKKEKRDAGVLRSVRMPETLYRRASDEAAKKGLSFNAFVVNALRLALGEGDRPGKLLDEVAKWLKEKYPPGKDFPEDVILRTFHHIRDDKKLRRLYNEIVLDNLGNKNYDALVPLHKNIGLLVKTILNAKVIGRSLELDPKVNLIKTYSILKKQEH